MINLFKTVDFKVRDFVKLFGQIRTSIDDNGKEHSNVRILSSKLLKAKEQMKGQDKSQEIAKLKSEIEEREKDLFYADSWEQSGQIRADIEKMKAKLNILTNSVPISITSSCRSSTMAV